MKISLVKKSSFRASHSHDGSLSEGGHEHDFVYALTLYGPVNAEGYLEDFRAVAANMDALVNAKLGGRNLNEIFAAPTTENIAVWIYDKMKEVYPALLQSVTVWETPDSYIIYEGKRN